MCEDHFPLGMEDASSVLDEEEPKEEKLLRLVDIVPLIELVVTVLLLVVKQLSCLEGFNRGVLKD